MVELTASARLTKAEILKICEISTSTHPRYTFFVWDCLDSLYKKMIKNNKLKQEAAEVMYQLTHFYDFDNEEASQIANEDEEKDSTVEFANATKRSKTSKTSEIKKDRSNKSMTDDNMSIISGVSNKNKQNKKSSQKTNQNKSNICIFYIYLDYIACYLIS